MHANKKTCRLKAHVGKNPWFLGPKRGETCKKKQEVHCKTGLNLVLKMATKMTAQFGIIYAVGIMTTKQKS